MNIEINTESKTIVLKEKIKLDDLINFLVEYDIDFEGWSLDYPIGYVSVPFQQHPFWYEPYTVNVKTYPYNGDVCCGSTAGVTINGGLVNTTTNVAKTPVGVNVTYTK